MIQVNTFLSLIPRPHPRGESLVMFGKSLWLHYTIGKNFPSVNHIAENTICDSNTGNPWSLQHDDRKFWALKKISCMYQFSTASYESLWSPGYRWGLGSRQLDESHGWSHCFVLIPRSMKLADTIWLCCISLVPRLHGRKGSPPTRPGYEAIATCTLYSIVPS